jgi:hypothetical protein
MTTPFLEVLNSIELLLNPRLLGDAGSLDQIRDHLSQGGLVVIRDAFREAFAERMFSCLDVYTAWKVHEGSGKHFHYHHHNVDAAAPPADLQWCQEIFRSEPTKGFVRRLSGKDCEGETVFTASLYKPGDHSLPHTDSSGAENNHRQVAFVWHLTKEWKSDWGGDFFWCPKNRYFSPAFNTLLLFNVSYESLHFVTSVSPHAQSKRLAVNGWWTGRTKAEGPGPRPQDQDQEKSLLEFI